MLKARWACAVPSSIPGTSNPDEIQSPNNPQQGVGTVVASQIRARGYGANAVSNQIHLGWRLGLVAVTRSSTDPIPPRAEAREINAILASVASGDRAAFARLYDSIVGPVFGLIRRIVRDGAISEEVTQDVMLEVWRMAPRYDPTQGPGLSWILTIARRRAIDRVRSEQASRSRAMRIASEQLEREHDDAAEAALRDSERSTVASALSHLSQLQREAIELAYYDGLTQNQIADRLGVPLGTIKTRIRDGMLRLQETLRPAT
jgi:RNA polymerase sigma-70 factor (ECF subfamily)